MPAVTQTAPPDDAQALCTLDRIDYADAFMVTAAQPRTSEEWVTAVLKDAAAPIRGTLITGWLGLGLKLKLPDDADHVLGWKRVRSDEECVLLHTDGRIGIAGELFIRGGPELLWCTFVQLSTPSARRIWAGMTPIHQLTVRSLLTLAARR